MSKVVDGEYTWLSVQLIPKNDKEKQAIKDFEALLGMDKEQHEINELLMSIPGYETITVSQTPNPFLLKTTQKQ